MAEIRLFRDEDAGDVAGILNESILAGDSLMITDPVSATDIREQHDALSDREVLVVMGIDSSCVGWGIVKRYSDREGYRFACETSVYLRRDLMGLGLGRVLQTDLLERCREFGYHHVVVRIVADNHRSIRMHERVGFEMVGVQREIGLLDGRWRDVAIMQRILVP